MSIRSRALNLWWNLVHRRAVEQLLDEELRSYVDLLAAEYVRAGASPAEAMRQALASTGIEQTKDETRDAWLGARIVDWWRELRYAVRSLARAPAYTITAIITLGVGIGGATAVFTVIKGTLLLPLPAAAAPDRLVSVERVQRTTTLSDFSYPDYVDLRKQTRTLSGLAAYDGSFAQLRDSAGATREWVSYVSGTFFSVLGVVPELGRTIVESDDVPYAPNPVVVISDRLWKARFAQSPNVIGARVSLNGNPVTVIGVAPPGFVGAMTMHHMDVWMPLSLMTTVFKVGDPLAARGDGWFRLIGRLKPGATALEAQRDLSTILQELGTVYPEDHGRSARVFANAGMTQDERDEASRIPYLLSMAVGLLLLIACANVAGLAIVRAESRRRELATRLALGASRSSLVGRLLIEGAVVATAGAILGVVLARIVVHSASITRTIVGMNDPDFSLDGRVLAVALGATALTALVVSLTPALQIAKVPTAAVLKDGSGGAVRRRALGQRVLVAIQVAISLVLLTSATIVVTNVRRVLATDPGFDIRNLTFAWLDADLVSTDTARARELYHEVLARAASDPAFAGAALTTTVPPQEWGTRGAVFRDGEQPSRAALAGHDFDYKVRSYIDIVTPSLFEVMRIPIVRGRAFNDADDANSPPVVIVSRRLANELWPDQNPIGKLLVWPSEKGPERPAMRIVGVAGDTRHAALTEEPPFVLYMPLEQHFSSSAALIVRTRAGGQAQQQSMQRAIGAANAPRGTSLSASAQQEVQPQRRASVWIGAFGVVALVLAAIGLYGIVAQGVLQRTRELAVRSALGATPAMIGGSIIGGGARLTAVGVAIGVGLSIAATRVLQSQLAGVSGVDVRAVVIAVLALGSVMLLATWIPARRASRMNPIEALRSD